MTTIDLDTHLAALTSTIRTELASKPAVVEKDDIDVASLPIVKREWHRLGDVVAVVADLKNSTQLGTSKHAASTASIYQASTGNVVETFDAFDANFLAIQGDGAFALFWGERRYERALCAGITVKTMSLDLVDQLVAKWPNDDNLPETGFKVGVASSPILVKRIGTPRNPAQQEPVWAGRAVNYAAKAAQSADRHQLIVTGSVWDAIKANDYLTISCGCSDGANPLWSDVVIERLREGDAERDGQLLNSSWCAVHGPEYASVILDGKKHRTNLDAQHAAMEKAFRADSLRVVRAQQRAAARARRLAGIQ